MLEEHAGSSPVAALLLALALAAPVGCDKRTPEEKGRDYAKEKIGFAEGAANVLKEKGQGLGEAVGKGLGTLVRGAGSGVKDSVYPPAKVQLAPDLSGSGLSVLRAHEGEAGSSARGVTVHLQFAKPFEGRLELVAMSSEGKLGSARTPSNVVQAADSDRNIDFAFPGDLRLSRVDHYEMRGLKAKAVLPVAPLDASAVSLSQLRETGHQVVIYVRFNKPFRGGLQLRALDERGEEIGRSEPTFELSRDSDSAEHIEFPFHPSAPIESATAFTVHKVKPKAKPAAAPAKR